ncbi:MAG: hypothetical protein ACR2L1_02195 [Pyrinomonadaceae bacterium]
MKIKLNGDEELIDVEETSVVNGKKREVVVITGASAGLGRAIVRRNDFINRNFFGLSVCPKNFQLVNFVPSPGMT